jgi:pimeloyl-ACP methyl ester carboxylesterase
MKKLIRALQVALGALTGFAVLLAPATPVFAHDKNNGHHNPKVSCMRQELPVQLTPGQGNSTYQMVGWLCAKGSPAGKPLQLLVPGLTYDHTYWDFPGYDGNYSYVQKAAKSGFATFAVDRIGTGQSSHPAASEVTFPGHANTILQAVDALKAGKVGGYKFKKIVGVGHSMGAGILMLTAETKPKAFDGMILLDFLHQANPEAQAALGAARHAASNEPKFANLPEGYITTKPGTRGLYYNTAFADSKVIATDEKLKQTTTTGELATVGVPREARFSQAIKVPVLLVVGEKDSLFCNEALQGLSCKNEQAVRQREAQYYSPEARLKIEVVKEAGHVTNLHYNAHRVFDLSNHWSWRIVR